MFKLQFGFHQRLFQLLTVCLVAGMTTLEADELKNELENIAQDWVIGEFKTEKIQSVSIGEFRCVNKNATKFSIDTTGGMEISNKLAAALEKSAVIVEKDANARIHGEYHLEKKEDKYILTISFKLTDLNNLMPIVVFRNGQIEITTPELIAKLTGQTGDINGKTPKEREAKLVKVIEEPKPDLKIPVTVVKTNGRSKLGMEILVKDPKKGEYLPRLTRIESGEPMILLNRGDVYAVRLSNDEAFPVAVELLIDGLNTLALHEKPAVRDGRFIVEPGEKIEIRGWSKNNNEGGANEFKVGSIKESVAVRNLPDSRIKVGMITATFARAWDANGPKPLDELNRESTRLPTEVNATVLGDRINQLVEQVQYSFGDARSIITLRYSDKPPGNLPTN